MKTILLFSMIFCFCSCGQEKKKVDQKLFSERTTENTPSIDLNTLPETWTELGSHKEEKVIYHPCDSDAVVYSIFKTETGWKFQYSGGHDAFDFDIKKVFLGNNDLKFYLEDPAYAQNNANVSFKNYKPGMKTAYIQFNDYTGEFVNENGINDYKTYKQPCEECWHDCPPADHPDFNK